MKTVTLCLSLLMFCFAPIILFAQKQQVINLPNGWALTPAGKQVTVGDLPLNMAVSPNKKLIAITNNGQSDQSVQLLDVKTGKITDSVKMMKSWYGIVFSADSKTLFASGGNDNCIIQFTVHKGKLIRKDSVALGKKWPVKISPAGMDIDPVANKLYVVTKENNMLYSISLASKAIDSFPLPAQAYSCKLSPNREHLYISIWGANKLMVWNTKTKEATTIMPIGDNPNELILTKDGKYLFVACADDNTVALVETSTMKVLEVLTTSLYPNAPNGSTPNGLALSEDEATLYIANADNNCLAVFDVSDKGESRSKGFIPTGWYPTSVRTIGKNIYVANGKGMSSFANPYGPSPVQGRNSVIYHQGDSSKPLKVQYIGGLMRGSVSIITEPSSTQLAAYSKHVYANTPYTKDKELMAQGEKGNPIPMKVGDASPIKYVFYIIKENRTYDQVLGDMPQGNGDTSLVLFGRKYTPNQHALAEQFVLLDNFYVDAEVSADGHNWTMAAYANDYTEKTWPTSYGARGGTYDYEGQKEIAWPRGGFIWDHLNRAGISYRTYGEFTNDYKANIPSLENNFCRYFTGYTHNVRDTSRFYQWKRDFDSLLAINKVPAFNSIRFGNDHTEGLRIGRPTPFAHVADNDYAVGLFVEYLSKSSIWDKSAVFIIEDDAQNGADHVDAHRSIAFVAGGFVKRGLVDHTPYTTSGMLRTMELILGLPPMSQYDAAAMPMWRCFSNQLNTPGFSSIRPDVNLDDVNKEPSKWAAISETLDFSKEDMAPDLLFNEIIWRAVKGLDNPMPAPRRGAFVTLRE
jgi:DNA-binding beta-propeller fold protein YncE